MKSPLEQDHYEVLEVGRAASLEEIERAYRVVRETYDGDNLALYSMFADRDAAQIRERIDEAYRVLSDEGKRHDYDAADVPSAQPNSRFRAYEEPAALLSMDAPAPLPTRMEASVDGVPGHGVEIDRLGGVSDTFRDLEADVEEDRGEFDGAVLRRARLRLGFDLDQIADITKVSIANLRNLEENNFADLPASVYVRGFVSSYARTIGLDPKRVVSSYLARLEDARRAHGHSRLLSHH